MDRYIVIHYHEVGLKKGNRDYFENRLCSNIAKSLVGTGAGPVRRTWGRLLVEVPAGADVETIKDRLGRVFGIAYFAEAWNSGQSLEELEQNAWELLQRHPFASFRIDARRGLKSYPHTSVAINQRVGAFVKERSQARVDLEKAERICWIEITEKYALMYTERQPGPGGR